MGPLPRFFECLQERIRGWEAQLLGTPDHEHLGPPLVRRKRGVRENQCSDLVDADVLCLGSAPPDRRGVVETALKDDDVRMGGSSLTRSGHCAATGRAAPTSLGGARRPAFADERLRQAERRALLADAIWPIEKISVVDP